MQGSIPGLERAPGGGHGNPLHGDSCVENPHGQRSLVGYSPWGLRESDMTEWRSTAHCQDVIENVIISYTIFLRTSGRNRYWYILALAAKVKLQSQNWAHHSKCRLTCLALFWLFFFILPFQAPFFIFIFFKKKFSYFKFVQSYCVFFFKFSSVAQCVRLFATPWTTARQASLSISNSRSPPKPVSIKSMMPSNHLILCCPLLLPPSIFPSIRVFSKESALSIRWPKYWNFSFSISPSNEHTGLISFRMDWLDLLAVQGTLKSLLKHHSSKASILWRSAFFIVQVSHPYVTWKNHSLDQMDLCWQSNVSAFLICCLGWS